MEKLNRVTHLRLHSAKNNQLNFNRKGGNNV